MDDRTRLLVEDLRSGNRRAAEALLVENLPALRAFVRMQAGRWIRERESSSDLVQSVCREVLSDLSGFEYRDAGSFRHWLFESALHKIVDRHRHWQAARRDPVRETPLAAAGLSGEAQLLSTYASMVTPSRQAIAREELDRLENAFDRLSEHYREVVILTRLKGFTYAQAAEHMGRSEASVRNLLGRALAVLARELGTNSAGSEGEGARA